jgi:hypothetical protein
MSGILKYNLPRLQLSRAFFKRRGYFLDWRLSAYEPVLQQATLSPTGIQRQVKSIFPIFRAKKIVLGGWAVITNGYKQHCTQV